MGARYLKAEDAVILAHYPTATRAEILDRIPNRTWNEIGVHARKMGIHRTSKAWGNSIREGRKPLRDTWSDEDNKKFDTLYPRATHALLLAAFPSRALTALRAHAQRRGLHRSREATGRQINIGRKNAKEQKKFRD